MASVSPGPASPTTQTNGNGVQHPPSTSPPRAGCLVASMPTDTAKSLCILNPQTLWVGGRQGKISVCSINVNSVKVKSTFGVRRAGSSTTTTDNTIITMCFVSRRDVVWCGSSNGEIHVAAASGATFLHTLSAHLSSVCGIVSAESMDSVISCGLDGAVKKWSGAGVCLQKIKVPGAAREMSLATATPTSARVIVCNSAAQACDVLFFHTRALPKETPSSPTKRGDGVDSATAQRIACTTTLLSNAHAVFSDPETSLIWVAGAVGVEVFSRKDWQPMACTTNVKGVRCLTLSNGKIVGGSPDGLYIFSRTVPKGCVEHCLLPVVETVMAVRGGGDFGHMACLTTSRTVLLANVMTSSPDGVDLAEEMRLQRVRAYHPSLHNAITEEALGRGSVTGVLPTASKTDTIVLKSAVMSVRDNGRTPCSEAQLSTIESKLSQLSAAVSGVGASMACAQRTADLTALYEEANEVMQLPVLEAEKRRVDGLTQPTGNGSGPASAGSFSDGSPLERSMKFGSTSSLARSTGSGSVSAGGGIAPPPSSAFVLPQVPLAGMPGSVLIAAAALERVVHRQAALAAQYDAFYTAAVPLVEATEDATLWGKLWDATTTQEIFRCRMQELCAEVGIPLRTASGGDGDESVAVMLGALERVLSASLDAARGGNVTTNADPM